MWSQDNSSRLKKSNKKGVSIMIGYVLLVTTAIIMGVIIYQWIKTYVPSDTLECPDGVSLFIKQYSYDCNNSELSLTLKNNGVFSVAGYFIYGSNKTDQELATTDLSNYTNSGEGKGGTVLLAMENSFDPNQEITNVFNLPNSSLGRIYSIDIIPIRFQEENNKRRFVSCGNSKIKEIINCGEVGVPIGCGNGSCDAGECAAGCTSDCEVSDCCGIESCNSAIGETCSTCTTDCGACPGGEREQIEYIGFENSGEINEWSEDPSSPAYGESLSISGSNECDPLVGSYMLSGAGNTNPNLVRYLRTAIDVTGYESITINYSASSEDTESADRIEFYYNSGSSWIQCGSTTNRNGVSCSGWENFECNVNLDGEVTDLVLGVAWETSATNEHAFWDDINITGISS